MKKIDWDEMFQFYSLGWGPFKTLFILSQTPKASLKNNRLDK